MLDAARATRARQVLVATEVGMLHQWRRAAPEVDFRAVNDRASCKYMKMIPPAALLRCLVEGADEVHVDPDIAAAGRRSVQRMIEIGQPGGGEECSFLNGRPPPTSSPSAPVWPVWPPRWPRTAPDARSWCSARPTSATPSPRRTTRRAASPSCCPTTQKIKTRSTTTWPTPWPR